MKREYIEITREDLYQRVWEETLRDIARELEISDVGLRKICRRNGIPTPPQGYHLMSDDRRKKKLHVPLPPRKNMQYEVIRIERKNESTNSHSRLNIESEWEQLISSPLIVSNLQSREIDRTLKAVRKPLHKKKIDDRGILIVPTKDHPIRVSPELLDRAIETLRSIFTRMSSLGATAPAYGHVDYGRPYLKIQWEGYDFKFRIEEHCRRIEIPKGERAKRLSGWGSYWDRWKSIPTNQLNLEINPPGYGIMTAKDGRTKIGDRIEDLVKRMFTAAIKKAEEERTKKIRMARAIEFLKLKDEERRKEEFEALKAKQLIREARQWKRVVELRSYLEAVEQAGFSSCKSNFGSVEEWAEWFEWAQSFVDSLDLIRQGRSGTIPPYPEMKEITSIPFGFLNTDDLEQAYEHFNESSIRAGTLSWNIGDEPSGSISYTMFHRQMKLSFKYRRFDEEWENVNQAIWFDETPCNYGGTRKWFSCPGCDQRVAVLYLVNTLFECRRCNRLSYASQGEGCLDRMSRKVNKISNKLEADEYIVDGDLWKPKGMHWKTFYRLKMAEIDADDRWNNALLARFGHWL